MPPLMSGRLVAAARPLLPCGPGDGDIERGARFGGYDARQFPAAQGALQEAVGGVLKDRKLVNEVCQEDVRTIKRAGAIIVGAIVGIRDLAEIAGAARIDCTRQGVGNLESQITPQLRVQADLQSVVMRIFSVLREVDLVIPGVENLVIVGTSGVACD